MSDYIEGQKLKVIATKSLLEYIGAASHLENKIVTYVQNTHSFIEVTEDGNPINWYLSPSYLTDKL